MINKVNVYIHTYVYICTHTPRYCKLFSAINNIVSVNNMVAVISQQQSIIEQSLKETINQVYIFKTYCELFIIETTYQQCNDRLFTWIYNINFKGIRQFSEGERPLKVGGELIPEVNPSIPEMRPQTKPTSKVGLKRETRDQLSHFKDDLWYRICSENPRSHRKLMRRIQPVQKRTSKCGKVWSQEERLSFELKLH